MSSGAGTVMPARAGNVAPAPIRAVAAAVAAAIVAAFQLGLLPFAQPLIPDGSIAWRALYYGFGGLTLALAAALLALDADVKRRAMPALAVCALALAPVLFHPFDAVARSYVVAMGLGASLVVLILGSAPLPVLRFSASVTALGAVTCLLDAFFPDGLTGSVGRAAGLAINPNVAAGGLLLGYAATFWAVARNWRLPFFLVTGAAIVATLSRSTLLGAAVIGAVGAVSALRAGNGARLGPSRAARLGPLLLGLALVLWVVAALAVNDRFAAATTDAYAGLRGAVAAVEKASQRIARAAAALGLDATARGRRSGALLDDQAEAQLEALGLIAQEEERENSIAARGVLMQRAYLAYVSGPPLGRGLAAAHRLAPHNTYLLLAAAFGHAGWLVPLAVVGLTLYRVRSAARLPLGLATAWLMATSHDILLVPGLMVPIAVGIAGLAADRTRQDPRLAAAAIKLVALAAAIAFAVTGLVAVVASGPVVMVMAATDILPAGGHAFLAAAPPPRYHGVMRLIDGSAPGTTGEQLLLFEDGARLVPAAPTTEEVLGPGRFMLHQRRTLLFSASDNSDPRWNGRTYRAEIPVELHPLFYFVLAAILLWCIAIVMPRPSHPARAG